MTETTRPAPAASPIRSPLHGWDWTERDLEGLARGEEIAAPSRIVRPRRG